LRSTFAEPTPGTFSKALRTVIGHTAQSMLVTSSVAVREPPAKAEEVARTGADLVRRAGLRAAVETVEREPEERQRRGHEIGLQRLERNQARTPGATYPQHDQQKRPGAACRSADRRGDTCEHGAGRGPTGRR
jgi:hypothetical protein